MHSYDIARMVPAQEPDPPDISSTPLSQNEIVLAVDAEAPTVSEVFIGSVRHPAQH
jgi:hypothetical protein